MSLSQTVRAVAPRQTRNYFKGQRQRNVLLYASEVPVVAALNRFRPVNEVFEAAWKRYDPSHYKMAVDKAKSDGVRVESKEERVERLIVENKANAVVKEALEIAKDAEQIEKVHKAKKVLRTEVEKLEAPAEVKKEIIDHVTSKVRTSFGARHELASIAKYEQVTKKEVKENNAKFYKRKLATVRNHEIFVGGRIDGITEGKVIEMKNRMQRFMDPLPTYDIAQLQTYMFILDVPEGEIVESVRGVQHETKSTKVLRDVPFWNDYVTPLVSSFSYALFLLLEDEEAQQRFLRGESDPVRQSVMKELYLRAKSEYEGLAERNRLESST